MKKTILYLTFIIIACLNVSFAEPNVKQVIIPASPPPKDYKPQPLKKLRSDVILENVPAYNWSYGCVPTSGAMMAGYYDRIGFEKLYTGPTGQGIAPLNNSVWGYGECPISASHQGIDGRTTKGHVDDYYIQENSAATDPYITGNWTEHSPQDCIADFVGCSMNKWNNPDGFSMLFYSEDNSPLHDYTGNESENNIDLAHGLKDFFSSKGYSVETNYNQPIYGFNNINNGFSFNQYVNEINQGRPVLIQITGHTMLGIGYNEENKEIILHSTWSLVQERMAWGGTFSGRTHFAVTVISLDGSNIVSNFEPLLTLMPTPGLPNLLNINLDIKNYTKEQITLKIDDSLLEMKNQHTNSFKSIYNLGNDKLDSKLSITLVIGIKSYNYSYEAGKLTFEEGEL